MHPQTIATRCADSESCEVRPALAAGVLCKVLTGGLFSQGLFEKLSAFFPSYAFCLEFPLFAALKLGLILHWHRRFALHRFGEEGLVAQTSLCGF
jgi:hypothetical protein